jgi:hypothetical protein
MRWLLLQRKRVGVTARPGRAALAYWAASTKKRLDDAGHEQSELEDAPM